MIFDSQNHKDVILKLVSDTQVVTTVGEAMKEGFTMDPEIKSLHDAVKNGEVVEPAKVEEPEDD